MLVLPGFVLLGSFLSSLLVLVLLGAWYLAVGLTWKENHSLFKEWTQFLKENKLRWYSFYGLGSIIYCAIALNQKRIYSLSHMELQKARREHRKYQEIYQRALEKAEQEGAAGNEERRNHNSAKQQQQKATLITFAGAGTLWAHYLGVIACLRDCGMITEHKLNNGLVRVAGISCGCSAAVVIYFGLTMIQAFKFGMMWQSVFDSRLLKFWFLSARLIESNIQRMFGEECGIDDSVLHRLQSVRGKEALTFGITALFQPSPIVDDDDNYLNSEDPPFLTQDGRTISDSLLNTTLNSPILSQATKSNIDAIKSQSEPSLRMSKAMQRREKRKMVQFECIDSFVSVDEMVRGAVCSMRTVPFFRSLGKFRGKYCCDGGLSSFYAIPPSADPSRIVRVSPIDPALLMRENVEQSAVYPSHSYQWHEFVDSGTFDDNLRRFQIGYRTAAKYASMCKFLAQGLEFGTESVKEMFEGGQWNQFVSERIQHWSDHLNAAFKE